MSVFVKRGVSAVVATVLLVMITVAAIGIIWVAIVPMIKESLLVGNVCKDVDISIDSSSGFTCYDSVNNLISVNIKKGPNTVDLSKIMFVVYSGGSSFSFGKSVESLTSPGSEVFYLNTTECHSSLNKISAYATVNQNNVEKQCDAISLNNIPFCNNSLVDVDHNEVSQRLDRETEEEVAPPVVEDDNGCTSDYDCEDTQYCSDSICVDKVVGSGTLADPFNIYDCVELQNIKNNLSASYSLARDIDCIDLPLPIISQFNGSLNGNNFAISNLRTIYSGWNNGIFNTLWGNISNVYFVNYSANSAASTGIQRVFGLAYEARGVISNVHFLNSSVLSGNGGFGSGIVHSLGVFGVIINSSFEGSVTGVSAGGIAYSSSGKILNSYVNAIVSKAWTPSSSTISSVGGLVGLQLSGSVINNSYFIGTVSGISGTSTKIGGLVAECSGNVSNSYSKVTIPQDGNCFSVAFSSAIVNSYYDNQTCTKLGGGGVSKNSTQMQTQSTYSGWDFANIWMINPSKNGGYPYLRWQN